MDTGASRSVLPHSSLASPSGPRLTAASGMAIPSWGTRRVPLKFGESSFTWDFLLAGVDRPILGLDFLSANALVVDAAGRRVSRAGSGELVCSLLGPASADALLSRLRHLPSTVRSLLAEFPGIVNDELPPGPSKHDVSHTIETEGRPLHAKARRLDPAKLSAAREEFGRMEAAGIIRRSQSPWASPLHMVPKPDGSWRPCGDYRRLNNVTLHDQYPLPNIQDFCSNLEGSAVFSKLDLVKGYYQVPMAEDDILKTAIITPFGLFEFLKMPFGLKNAAQTFQRMMDRLFNAVLFVFVYLDDILVYSPNMAVHLDHLRRVFQLLDSHGLVINPAKCVFAADTVEFLGHQVTATGLTPLRRHVSALQDLPRPQDVPQLQRFLGLVNFYRRFLPGIAGTLRPLTDALKGKPKKLLWSSDMELSFVASKAALASATALAHPSPSAPVSLAVDASSTHVGAVLQQKHRSGWKPLAFFSKKLSATETRYSTFDRELLAVYLALRHFRFLLEGRRFHILTDHTPLVSALHRVSPPWSARHQRHHAYMSEFTSDIRHISGVSNVVADSLTRHEHVSAALTLSYVSGMSQEAVSTVRRPYHASVPGSSSPVLRSASAVPSPVQARRQRRRFPPRTDAVSSRTRSRGRLAAPGAPPPASVSPPPLVPPPSEPSWTPLPTSLSTRRAKGNPLPEVFPTPPAPPAILAPPPASPAVSAPQLPTTLSTRPEALVPVPLPAAPSASAPAPPDSVPGIDFRDMAVRQLLCPEVQKMVLSSSLRLVRFPVADLTLWCDVSTPRLRPLVPVVLRPQVFSAIHGVAHPGARASRRLISARYVWGRMNSDVTRWVKECQSCQRGKVFRHAHSPPDAILVPHRRFSHIHVDLVGPLPSSGGFTHLFTIVDRTSRWPEAIPMVSTTASACAQALVHHWVSRFGVPAVITSDRGPQFTSAVWSALSASLNLRLAPTTAFHPQANGLVERFHRRLKDGLRARLAGPRWLDHLPWVLLGLRCAPAEVSGVSPASAVYGAELTLPGEFLDVPEPPSKMFLDQFQRQLELSTPVSTRHNKPSASSPPSSTLQELQLCSHVYVRRDGHVPALSPLYEGPYEVVSRSVKYFRLRMGARVDSVSVTRLKPAFLPPGSAPALPPARGRPRGRPPLQGSLSGLRTARRVSFCWPPSTS